MIYHITMQTAWKTALRDGDYHPESLSKEGFIHCSTGEQIVKTANTFYKAQKGLVLLFIDPNSVRAEIRYENTMGGVELFPHIYGALNLDAVLRVVPFEPGDDGLFVFPINIGSKDKT